MGRSTELEIMSITGHRSPTQAERYAANKKKARDGGHPKLEQNANGTASAKRPDGERQTDAKGLIKR